MHTDQSLRSADAAFVTPEAPATRGLKSSGALPFLLGAGLLGTIGVFVHMAHASALTATWFRCAFGLAGLTVWILVRGQGRALRLTRSTGHLVLLASLLMVLGWALFFAAIERTSTSMAVVLFHMQPMWVLVLGALWLHERSSRQRLVSVFVAMAGLVLATGVLQHHPAASQAAQASYWIGVVFCLVGAFCTACVTVLARRLRQIPAGALAWWQCALGTAVLWIWPMRLGWPEWGASWVWLASLGLIHTAAAYTLMYAGMARLTTGRIAVFQFIYPAIAILIDWQFFDQRLGRLQLLGIAIMGLAIWNSEQGWGRRRLAIGRG